MGIYLHIGPEVEPSDTLPVGYSHTISAPGGLPTRLALFSRSAVMWLVAMVALLLTAGDATPLPFTAVHADTGAPITTWGEYLAAPNRCVVTDGSLAPGVSAEQPGCVWAVAWINPDPTGVPGLPTAPWKPPGTGCGKWFTIEP